MPNDCTPQKGLSVLVHSTEKMEQKIQSIFCCDHVVSYTIEYDVAQTDSALSALQSFISFIDNFLVNSSDGVQTLVVYNLDLLDGILYKVLYAYALQRQIWEQIKIYTDRHIEHAYSMLFDKFSDIVAAGINVVFITRMENYSNAPVDVAAGEYVCRLEMATVLSPILNDWVDIRIFGEDNFSQHQNKVEIFADEGIIDLFNLACSNDTTSEINNKAVSTDKASANHSRETIPDYVPNELAVLMKDNNLSVKDIETILAAQGYCPPNTPLTIFDAEFIKDVVIEGWSELISFGYQNDLIKR